MEKAQEKRLKRQTRHKRIRAKVIGTASVPRLSVYRSNTKIYAQLIDDDKGITLVSSSDAKSLAKEALAVGITKVVFDRGGFIYAGKIKAFAEEARKAGLIF